MTASNARARRIDWRALGMVCLAGLALGSRPARASDLEEAVKAFEQGAHAPDTSWKDRAEAYSRLAFFDGAEIVTAMLRAMEREENAAIHQRAIGVLSGLATVEARAQLIREATSGEGDRRFFALLALQDLGGTGPNAPLLSLLADEDLVIAAQAARILGARQIPEALDPLCEALQHPDWHVRRGAAIGLRLLAGEAPKPKLDPQGNVIPERTPQPWTPPFYDVKKVAGALIAVLEKGGGPERGDAIRALERLLKDGDFGWDPAAWRAYLGGAKKEDVQRRPRYPLSIFRIPLFGQRIVVVWDHSNATDGPHPFGNERLQALCEVPGGRPIPWYQIRTKSQFTRAHVERLVQDAQKPVRLEVIFMGAKAEPALGRLSTAGTATRRKVEKAFEDARLSGALDVYGALQAALDAGGARESQAWEKGPDEIVLICGGKPWRVPVTDEEEIAAAVGLRARRRVVPIHTVGVGPHPWGMMRQLSDLSAGTYLGLTE